MCYSAQIIADYRLYVRLYGALIGIEEFADLFWRRREPQSGIRVPKALEAAFAQPEDEAGQRIQALIAEHTERQALLFEQQLFEQRTRLVKAEQALQIKPTRKAAEEQRIASGKIEWARRKLAELRRRTLEPDDARIFPDWYAPVMVVENGQRRVLPMRYHCLPAGRPAAFDRKFPGTFNARRDSLGGYWKGVFGVSHGVALVSAFYENVPRHKAEGRELREGEAAENQILEFRPADGRAMAIACLWSRWQAPGGDQPPLLSFAAITDEPPPEVAAAGHDRCVIPLRDEHLADWLQPDPRRLDLQQAILDDRERPYYEHRLAA